MGSAWILYNIFRFGFALVFVGLHCVLMVGLFLEYRRDKRARRDFPALAAGTAAAAGFETVDTVPFEESAEFRPLVSVIVPFNNEALRMEGLLRTLGLQDFPNAEYIFVDDRSTDGSLAMLRSFAETHGHVRIISLGENPGPNHKQYALGRGIDAAKGELLLFTDADCEASPSWIGSMALRMTDERVGAIIGPVFKLQGGPPANLPPANPPVRPTAASKEGGARNSRGQRFFRVYQCFDHAIRYMYLAASTGIGAAGGGFGNNLILRRAALDAIGGYDAIPPSPTEDAALVSQIRADSKYQVRSACGADVYIMTRGENSWGALLNQTLRWNNGGLFSPELSTRLNFGFLMITISMGILAIPLIPFIPSLWPLPVGVLIVMTMNTLAILMAFGSALPKAGPMYIIHAILTPIHFTLLTILGFCGISFEWKGSRVSAGQRPASGH
jgi:cellulose synthase/poly-beta-1,6-N-acetylglucosamine synthase-like glycosyltransferase